MATRSTIWYKDEETNTYKGIYCHWDGYPSNNGSLLLHNYRTIDEVKELISMGFLSSLGKDIETCEFYHRDRNEDLNVYEVFSKDDINEYFEEYTYLFENGKWYIHDYETDVYIELTLNNCVE